MKKILLNLAAVALVVSLIHVAKAQNAPTAGPVQIQPNISLYYTTPISFTAAVNVASVLSIPAPPAGLYNYVCRLAYNVSNDNTGTVITNVVSTSTNFNSFAVKISHVATASANYDSPVYFRGTPAGGCVKSTAPGTATTFTSPAGLIHSAWTWYAMYFQAP